MGSQLFFEKICLDLGLAVLSIFFTVSEMFKSEKNITCKSVNEYPHQFTFL